MGGNSPCASCKLLRRRCAKDCIFAPYFPSDDPQKFAIVHKVFGASNVSKMLQVSVTVLCFPLFIIITSPLFSSVFPCFPCFVTFVLCCMMMIIQELPIQQRADAVSSLVYEANARVRDPVYGCVGAISYLQNQVSELQMQLAVAQAEILCIQMQNEPVMPPQNPEIDPHDHYQKSYFLQNELPQYLNFTSSSNAIHHHDSLKRESIFGHDMVS